MSTGSPDRRGRPADVGARARHPAARGAGGHLAGPAARLAAFLVPPTASHPDVAAAVVAVRGAQGRSGAAFCAAYGLAGGELEDLEQGRIAADAVPATLRILTPVAALAAAFRRGSADGPVRPDDGRPGVGVASRIRGLPRYGPTTAPAEVEP